MEKHLLCADRQSWGAHKTQKESIFARVIFLLNVGVCVCVYLCLGCPFLTLNPKCLGQDVLEYNIHHPNLLNELSSYFMVDSSFIQITPIPMHIARHGGSSWHTTNFISDLHHINR